MWTVNFQMFRLDLEKAEEPELNCQCLLDHRKTKRVTEKHLLLLYWLHQSLWLCSVQFSHAVMSNSATPWTAACLCRSQQTVEKESAWQCRSQRIYGFDSWVWKMPWKSKWQPTPVLNSQLRFQCMIIMHHSIYYSQISLTVGHIPTDYVYGQ